MRGFNIKFWICIILLVQCLPKFNGDWVEDDENDEEMTNETFPHENHNANFLLNTIVTSIFQRYGIPVPDIKEMVELLSPVFARYQEMDNNNRDPITSKENAKDLAKLKETLVNVGDSIHSFVSGPHYRPAVRKLVTFIVQGVATPTLTVLSVKDMLKILEFAMKHPSVLEPFIQLRSMEQFAQLQKMVDLADEYKSGEVAESLKWAYQEGIKVAKNFFKEEL